jgi:hypothetical protein
MNAPTSPALLNPKAAGLAKLREPFDLKLISKLPKPTKAQTDAVKADYKAGIRCTLCGTWHHPQVQHLDYVGHAALTDRLLDADPEWNWEPCAVNPDGSPVLDKDGGMWIKLTVCGVTRLGYGDAESKNGPNATKERIGDALRNAAMRFGAALDLWSKVDIHFDEHDDGPDAGAAKNAADVKRDTKPEPKAPEPWPADKFKAALEKHGPLVKAGTKTADDLLAWLNAKHPFTAEQEAAVRALSPVKEAA